MALISQQVPKSRSAKAVSAENHLGPVRPERGLC